MKRKIDIIIKSWGAVEYTILALDAISKNTQIPYQITIVDDGSNPDVLKLLRSFKKINLIEHGINLGPARTALTGFQHTNSPFTILMDNDIIVPEKWLENMLPYFKDKKVAICAPLKIHQNYKYPGINQSSHAIWEKIKKQTPRPLDALDLFTNNETLVNFGKKLVAFNSLKDQKIIAPPGFVSSSCIVVNRKLITKAGGIVRNLFQSYGGEDVDLCWRVGSLGFKIIKTAKVYVHHFEHASIEANKYNYTKAMENNNKILYNLWGKKILALETHLLAKMTRSELNKLYPFISIFKKIKEEN